ncbi:Imidazolonepropionase [compost metagenome]
MSLSGGSDVAIKVGALSGDHLLQVTEKEIKGLAKSEVTCVLLPTADLYMKCKYPPARQMIEAGARVALATDFNPGTSPTQDVSLVGLLARLEMKMSLPEVIAAYTIGAAYALRRESQVGSIEIGKNADLLCTKKDWQTLFYNAGESFADQVFIRGKSVYLNKQ